jgi:NADH:ubiquinone oxidoreductase subunit 2 (subunit N)
MALIKCSECGKPVSTEASVCPKCGAPVVVTTANNGNGTYVPFWLPARIVGAVLCAMGFMALLFAIVHSDSLESQFRRGFNQEDWTLYIALGVGTVLLLVGIPLLIGFIGMFNRLNPTGKKVFIIAFIISVLLLGALSLFVVWIPFVIPKLNTKPQATDSSIGE